MDMNKKLSLQEGIRASMDSAKAKFKESIDISLVLSTKENVRGIVNFPYPLSTKPKILAFVFPEEVQNAKNAGADLVGGEELITAIKENKKLIKGFKYCVTTRSLMPNLSKIAKILGPKGLMPNPKWGMVSDTEDVTNLILAFLNGKVLFKSDKNGTLHLKMGTNQITSPDQISENVLAFWHSLKESKPKTVKGDFISKVFINSTMGKAYALNIKELDAL